MIGKHDTECMYKRISLGRNAYVKISETNTTNTNLYDIYIYILYNVLVLVSEIQKSAQ